MNQQENYFADKPVEIEKEDKFQRYPFSKRIAQTIINRQTNDCLVIGINGKWGEGKSSVLHFIEREIEIENTIKRIHLNPWRYNNEEQLLENFLYKISESIGQKINKHKKVVGEFVSKYGKFDLFGFDIENIGKSLALIDLESLKGRINQYLLENSCKIVVFIDDIDRLDKNEIYALFKLLKLTADFSNTTYLLSFDKDMVASAIGEQFGKGNKEAGENFLEKIIQVSLNIPKAQTNALRKYTLDLINNIINLNALNIPKDDLNEFLYYFDTIIITKISSPRTAVIYANSLSFIMPLLYGEVNMRDLMILEAIKLFYPKHYHFIKDYPSYFLSNRNSSKISITRKQQLNLDDLKIYYEKLSENHTIIEQKGLNDLIALLFPALTSVNLYDENWIRKQKICTTQYFERYFSYTVLEGEISDVILNKFIDELEQISEDDLSKTIHEMITIHGDIKFLLKLQNFLDELSWKKTNILLNGIVKNSELLSKEGTIMNLNMDSGYKHFARLIYQLYSKKDESINIFDSLQKLIESINEYPLCSEIVYTFELLQSDKKIIKEPEIEKLNSKLLDKMIKSTNDETEFFTKYPNESASSLIFWSKHDKNSMELFVKKFLDLKPENIITFLLCFIPDTNSTSYPKPYKSDLTLDNYKIIISIIDKDLIIEKLLKYFSLEEVNKESPYWKNQTGSRNSPINLARQFFHFNKSN